jgi:hypothetical protein
VGDGREVGDTRGGRLDVPITPLSHSPMLATKSAIRLLPGLSLCNKIRASYCHLRL